MALPGAAEAHVKWFEPYDVAATPRPLAEVLTPTFAALILCSILLLFAFCRIERTALGLAFRRALDNASRPIRSRIEDMLRAATGAFFVAAATMGGFILTPELRTDAAAVPLVQL